ncbi:hypothetical protein [Tengunoibacter tsumagoiensis]|uniref:DUF624 domain-containing protein n=1 Tax=Tengunoibacter tsumagoiensis TaxID=2014871 RepID=A0A402A131_9CHLR|nr:hypothetical protein [Tengunoibacter tsumagoiensis]GCE12766.1 hypothetical protein KTT_26250 [Tengunoibacter tsumagoiensis]
MLQEQVYSELEGRDSEVRHPIWGAFLLLKENLERIMLLNIGWGLQLFPALVALAFPDLPLWLRAGFFVYSAFASVLAGGTLYAVIARLSAGEDLHRQLIWDELRRCVRPCFRSLIPLYSLCALLLWLIVLLPAQFLPGSALAQFALLCLLFCSIYWGPILIHSNDLSWFALLKESGKMVWRAPYQTLLVGLVIGVILVCAIATVAGFFLLAPGLVVTLQLHTYQLYGVARRRK